MLLFFFHDTPTAETYTLSLHDALPISNAPTVSGSDSSMADFANPPYRPYGLGTGSATMPGCPGRSSRCRASGTRSEEHTSELQSRLHLVCRLLLEKKNKINRQVQRIYV